MIGIGKLELINPETGETVFETESRNVILDQAIAGLAGESGGLPWNNSMSWRIAVGTGSKNPPEATGITKLDRFLGMSGGENVTDYYRAPLSRTFTVAAEFSPEELLEAGNTPSKIIEAGLAINGNQLLLFNRLMFRSDPLHSAGQYTYYVRARFLGINGPVFSEPSNEMQSVLTAGQSTRLDWIHSGNVTDYYVFRKINGGPAEVHVTQNQYLIDAGFDTAIFSPFNEGTITVDSATVGAPGLVRADPQTGPQPYPVTKSSAFACRITISITFGVPT